MPDARPLTPEERSSINEFFWSHFKEEALNVNDMIDSALKTPEAQVEIAKINFCENLLKIMESHKLSRMQVAGMLKIDWRALDKLFK